MSTLSSSCSSLAFSDGSFKRVVNISQRHSGITQLKSIVTQLVPFNTIRPLVSDTSSARVSQCKPTDAWHPRAQNTHLPKAMLHRTKFMRCSAGLLQKRGHVGIPQEKLKNVLAVPSHRPDIPGQQRRGGIRIFHLSTAQTSLEADTMLDSHVAVNWRVLLGSVPSSSQSKWGANP